MIAHLQKASYIVVLKNILKTPSAVVKDNINAELVEDFCNARLSHNSSLPRRFKCPHMT